jgi:hypothetical protein
VFRSSTAREIKLLNFNHAGKSCAEEAGNTKKSTELHPLARIRGLSWTLRYRSHTQCILSGRCVVEGLSNDHALSFHPHLRLSRLWDPAKSTDFYLSPVLLSTWTFFMITDLPRFVCLSTASLTTSSRRLRGLLSTKEGALRDTLTRNLTPQDRLHRDPDLHIGALTQEL